MLAGLGAVVAELNHAAVVCHAGCYAPADVDVRVVDGPVDCRTLAHAELGDIVCESAVGRRAPTHAEVGCRIACVVVRTVERIHACPICCTAVGGDIASDHAEP